MSAVHRLGGPTCCLQTRDGASPELLLLVGGRTAASSQSLDEKLGAIKALGQIR